MTNANDTFEEEYEDYDAFDEEDEERGLSGFAVLVMGVVMIAAFFSVVWIAYQQGIKTGQSGAGGETPYVAADPEPIKIETAQNDGSQTADREVYDAFDGENDAPVTVLAEGPEEPVSRDSADPIGSIAASAAGEDVSAEMESRLASLAEEDAALFEEDASEDAAAPARAPSLAEATRPTPANASSGASASGTGAAAPNAASVTPARPAAASSGPLSGSHLVQVGAFRSNAEAAAQWSRMQSRLGDYLDGKSPDVERADLGERGVYHRLRIGPFGSSGEARTYCSGLKERGQDCLVKSI